MTQLFVLTTFLLVCFSWNATEATTYEVIAYYYNGANSTMCTDTPDSLYIEGKSVCSAGRCETSLSYSNSSVNSTYCTSDYRGSIQKELGNTEYGYLLAQYYNDSDCSVLSFARATKRSSESHCEKVPRKYSGFDSYQQITTNNDGTTTVDDYMDERCSTDERYRSVTTYFRECSPLTSVSSVARSDGYSSVIFLDENSITSSSNSGEVSTSSSKESSASSGTVPDNSLVTEESSGTGTGAIIGIIAGLVALLVLLLAIVIRRRSANAKRGEGSPRHNYLRRNSFETASESLEGAPHGRIGLWDDDVITAARVPRDKVRVGKLVSRGAYGEVYTGIFNDEQVAVKMLPPESRKSIPQVNAFLAEVKTTATMEHPCIVTFVGVAWDSLADLCVVMEFMEGGDLRSLLNKFEASRHPVGFNRQKITIALHVCHALTYMHSMSPVVIHRDLKSRNILLSSDHQQAKLTDFGISRERLDSTMTAGVGTSLWMAPEVMLGERYDEKADMFSFGVVLSELDVHSMPYENSRAQSRESSGREMGDAVLFQKVASGAVRVEFSAYGPQSMVDLGVACVSVDPKQRPSAAEALYRLQVILRQEC